MKVTQFLETKENTCSIFHKNRKTSKTELILLNSHLCKYMYISISNTSPLKFKDLGFYKLYLIIWKPNIRTAKCQISESEVLLKRLDAEFFAENTTLPNLRMEK